MKSLRLLAIVVLTACSSPFVSTSTKLSEAEVEIQKARASIPGFNASNFLPGPTSEVPPLLKSPEEISSALKNGGYIVYMRHGRTQYDQITLEREHRAKGTFDLNNCATQRARTISFLSPVPAAGKNHNMMAHGGIFLEATGFVIQEEHAVVLDPKNLKVLVARIAPDQWQQIKVGAH
jgi:hypothetical protein